MILSQMKGQDKNSEKQLNEVKLDNLQEKEFRIKIVKIIQDLRKKKNQGKDWEDVRNVYRRPRRTKKQKTEMNNTWEEINGRITEAEERINDLEDRMMEITATEQNIEKRMKKRKTA